MSEHFHILETTDGVTRFVQARHVETVSSPVTNITIEHFIPRRHVSIQLVSDDHWLLPNAYINECYFGEHSPVVTNEFYVDIVFNSPFSGEVILYY